MSALREELKTLSARELADRLDAYRLESDPAKCGMFDALVMEAVDRLRNLPEVAIDCCPQVREYECNITAEDMYWD